MQCYLAKCASFYNVAHSSWITIEITVLLGIRIKGFFIFFTWTLIQKQQLLVSFQLIRVVVCRTGLGQGGSLCRFNQQQFSTLTFQWKHLCFVWPDWSEAGRNGCSASFTLVLAKTNVRKLQNTVLEQSRRMFKESKRKKDCWWKNRLMEWEAMIMGDWLTSERSMFCDFTYLFSCDHGYNIHPLFPYHLPEVMARVWQRSLGSNVVPLLSAYSNLGWRKKKESKKKKVSAQVLSSTCARTAL